LALVATKRNRSAICIQIVTERNGR
jgi:hypothetical protein